MVSGSARALAIDDNLTKAVETLADSFGTQPDQVRTFLDHWEQLSGPDGLREVANRASAALYPVDARRVQIHDKFDQFIHVEIEADDLKAALQALMAEMRKSSPQHH